MRALPLAVAVGLIATAIQANSQQGQGAYYPWRQPGGAEVPGYVLLCATGNAREAVPCGLLDKPVAVLGMSFQRVGDPFLLAAGTAPQQYAVTQPDGTKSYRGVNPCSVDIRIRTVSSMSETVTASTGTRFLARTLETLGSSPALSNPRIISIMTTADPGPGGCVFELGYGNGG